MTESPRQLRARLLEEASRRARAELARQSQQVSYRPAPDMTDAMLAAAQAEAKANTRIVDLPPPPPAAGRPIANTIAVKAAIRPAGDPDRILAADVAPIARETPAARWYAMIRAAAAEARPEGIRLRAIEKVASQIVAAERKDKTGFAWRSLTALQTMSGYSARHVQRATAWLRENGLLDKLRVMIRDANNKLVNDANIYVPTVDIGPAPLPDDVDASDPAPRAALTGRARLAAFFRLALRPLGFNTTPLRPRPAACVLDSG